MTLSPGTATFLPRPAIAGRTAAALAEVAITVQTPANALGFPQPGGLAQTAGAQSPLALSPPDTVAVRGDGGFESLPVVLVARIVVPYLGIPGFTAMKGLAVHYPDFRDAIGAAVNADPLFQSLGKLVQPMRNIVLRDLLVVGNFRRSSLLAQTTLARSEIRSSVWLPLVEQLLQHQVDGVQPEHAALLVLCDRILAGQKPTDRERDNAVRAADAVGFDETQCRHLIDAAQLLQSGDDAWGLVKAIADYRKSVLGDAFEKIASAFAAEAGWSLEGLLAESAPVRAHGLN